MTDAPVVTADDTTGALETAAVLADAGWRSRVVGRAAARGHAGRAEVIDLQSRHLDAAAAAEQFTRVLAHHAVRAHKIDSTLRGAWPEEVGAAIDAGRRVVLVPAYPEAGRTCTGGVVRVHGAPLDATAFAADPRTPPRTSRPAALLARAVEVADAEHLAVWLLGSGPVAVADAASPGDVSALVAVLRGHREVLVVGPAGVVAGAVGNGPGTGHALPVPRPPVLVVAGSAHPATMAQLEVLRRRHPDVPVVSAPPGAGLGASAALDRVAGAARREVERLAPRTVVLVGGDTARAVLAEAQIEVAGSLEVGVAVGTASIGRHECTVVSKPGGFGDPSTLVRLVARVEGVA